jgi:hypothetical protein
VIEDPGIEIAAALIIIAVIILVIIAVIFSIAYIVGVGFKFAWAQEEPDPILPLFPPVERIPCYTNTEPEFSAYRCYSV